MMVFWARQLTCTCGCDDFDLIAGSNPAHYTCQRCGRETDGNDLQQADPEVIEVFDE